MCVCVWQSWNLTLQRSRGHSNQKSRLLIRGLSNGLRAQSIQSMLNRFVNEYQHFYLSFLLL